MGPVSPMVHLTTVMGSFHARVIGARLASEGVAVTFRGLDEGPYPLAFPVDVLVSAEDLSLAREILLADAVDAAFVHDGATDPDGGVLDGEAVGRLWQGGSPPAPMGRSRPWPRRHRWRGAR